MRQSLSTSFDVHNCPFCVRQPNLSCTDVNQTILLYTKSLLVHYKKRLRADESSGWIVASGSKGNRFGCVLSAHIDNYRRNTTLWQCGNFAPDHSGSRRLAQPHTPRGQAGFHLTRFPLDKICVIVSPVI